MAISASMLLTGGTILLLFVCATNAVGPGDWLNQPSSWWTNGTAQTYADNILTWQDKILGGWPKNGDTTLPGGLQNSGSTFDNGATTPEINYLAIVYKENGSTNKAWYASLIRAIEFMLSASYPSGAIPQRLPLAKTYHSLATYNDGVTSHVLNLYRSIATQDRFTVVPAATRARCLDRFNKGIEFVRKSQIIQGGVLTAWGQQHDPVDYTPQWGRSYEMPCISGAESVGVTQLIMSLPKTAENNKIVEAVNAWYIRAGVPDISYARSGECLQTDKPGAAPLWARMYDPKTSKPIFADRDGVVVDSINKVGKERRCGYMWWGRWGVSIFSSYARYAKLPIVTDAPAPAPAPATPATPPAAPAAPLPTAPGADKYIYDNEVKSPFTTGYSWGNGVAGYLVTDFTPYVVSKPSSIRYIPGNYNAVAFTCDSGCINTKTYGGISFYVNGGTIDTPLTIRMRDSAGADTGSRVSFTAPNRAFKKVTVSFDTHFKVPTTLVSKGFYIQSGEKAYPGVFIDEVVLVARATKVTYSLGAGETPMPFVNQTWNTTDPYSQPDDEDEEADDPDTSDILKSEGIDEEVAAPPADATTSSAAATAPVAAIVAAVLLVAGALVM